MTPHLGASTDEAQEKAGVSVARSVRLALGGDLVPDAVNVSGGAVPEEVRPGIALVEKLGRIFTSLAGSVPVQLDVDVQGEITAHDVSIWKLAALKGLFTDVTEDPVTYVNAPLLAEQRGCEVRLLTDATMQDYRNVTTLRGTLADGATISVSGTLTGPRLIEKIVGVNGFDIEVPLTEHLAFFTYVDRPGVIGTVGRLLGDAQVNIAGMQVARNEKGGQALVALTVDTGIPADVARRDRVRGGCRRERRRPRRLTAATHPTTQVCRSVPSVGTDRHTCVGAWWAGSAARRAVVQHEVEQHRSPPAAVEVEEVGDQPVLLEPAPQQDRLRRPVVDPGACAEPVQPELAAAPHEQLERSGRQALAEVAHVDPVADVGTLHGPADDVLEVRRPDHVSAVPQQPAVVEALGDLVEASGDVLALAAFGEEGVGPGGLPRPEVFAVADVGGRQGGSVVETRAGGRCNPREAPDNPRSCSVPGRIRPGSRPGSQVCPATASGCAPSPPECLTAWETGVV